MTYLPPDRMHLSFVNLAETATVTASSTLPNYEAENLKWPADAYKVWHSASLGAHNIIVNFGTPTQVDLLILVNANFQQIIIGGDGGAPGWSQAVTLPWNRMAWRYQYGQALENIQATPGLPFVFSRLVMSIPVQTPVDGAAGYWLGGIWAGRSVQPPINPRFDLTYEPITPLERVGPRHGGMTQVLHMGNPRAKISMTRIPRATRQVPLTEDDQFSAWMDLDYRCFAAGQFGMLLSERVDSSGFIMLAPDTTSWRRSRLTRMESPVVYEEAVTL